MKYSHLQFVRSFFPLVCNQFQKFILCDNLKYYRWKFPQNSMRNKICHGCLFSHHRHSHILYRVIWLHHQWTECIFHYNFFTEKNRHWMQKSDRKTDRDWLNMCFDLCTLCCQLSILSDFNKWEVHKKTALTFTLLHIARMNASNLCYSWKFMVQKCTQIYLMKLIFIIARFFLQQQQHQQL